MIHISCTVKWKSSKKTKQKTKALKGQWKSFISMLEARIDEPIIYEAYRMLLIGYGIDNSPF